MERASAEKLFRSGANWFYWIAGLSVVNCIGQAMGGKWIFIIGLGITVVIDGFAKEAFRHLGSATIQYVGFAFDLLIIGMFALFGFLANKKQTWSFIVGMILYGLDALIYLAFKDFLAFGFHILALFFIYRGLKMLGELKKMEPVQNAPDEPVSKAPLGQVLPGLGSYDQSDLH